MPISSAGPGTTSSPVLDHLRELHARCKALEEGQVATYIPELAKANPDWFGICLATATGAVYEVGDTRQPFTIQSISKPFVYGLALEDNGRSGVLPKVGAEPTGDAFNSISLEPRTGRPRNPMINAGAIATAGLVAGRTPEKQFQRVLETFGHYAGRPLSLDEAVYRSESETGHRNRAIGHMLRNFGILTTDPVPVVELYFKQCSVSVDCRDLSLMAATLANNGVHPLTGRRALRGEYVESVLSVMEMCGMYDYAGEWVYHVGLPAKSGVSGAVIAVLPGQLGIAVFSPRLDAQGNTVRGIRVCQELSRNLDLHLLNRPVAGRSTIRSRFSAAEFNSSRVRSTAEAEILARHGERIQVWQLQGNVNFSTTEVVVRDILAAASGVDDLILDFKRVLSVNESACHLFFRLRERLAGEGRRLIWCQVGAVPLLRRIFRLKLRDRFAGDFVAFEDVDLALERCEDELVTRHRPPATAEELPRLEDFAVLAGLSPEEFAVVAPRLERRSFRAGDTLINAGDEAAEMFLLARGRVSVLVDLVDGVAKRLASFSPGMAFGEMAMIDRAPRSARIVAEADGECEVLSLREFEALGATHPGIKIKLLHNLCLELCRKLRKANRELNVLS
jgi:glutaminase